MSSGEELLWEGDMGSRHGSMLPVLFSLFLLRLLVIKSMVTSVPMKLTE